MCQSANRKSAIFSLNPEIANPQMSLLSQSANLQIGKLFTIGERGWNTSFQGRVRCRLFHGKKAQIRLQVFPLFSLSENLTHGIFIAV